MSPDPAAARRQLDALAQCNPVLAERLQREASTEPASPSASRAAPPLDPAAVPGVEAPATVAGLPVSQPTQETDAPPADPAPEPASAGHDPEPKPGSEPGNTGHEPGSDAEPGSGGGLFARFREGFAAG